MSTLGDVVSGAKRAGIGFFGGLTYPFRGLGFVYFKHPGLIRYWIWPVLITLAVAALVVTYVINSTPDLLSVLLGGPSDPDSSVERLIFGLKHLVMVVVTVVVVFVALWVIAMFVPVLAAPFNDALSEEVERIRTGKTPLPFSFARLGGEIVRTVRIEVTKLAVYAAIMIPLFFASFLVPGVGGVLYTVFGLVFTSMYYAIDYVDWPASRRGLGVRDRAGLARTHLPVMLGFGLSVWVLVFVPFVNLFLIPAAVAGGTMLYLDLAKLGSVPE